MSTTTGLPPIVWKNSPKFGCMVQGTRGRAGLKVLGWVMHHIVGSLPVADTIFLDPKQKLASAHFGIGYVDGRLEIHQYVDLTDTAWCNGDASEPSWSVTRNRPGINPNLYTISTEHENDSRGRVSAAVWAASIALVKLCTSRDAAAIRAAGIRVRDDDTVRQLAAIPRTPEGYVDHHQIAGPKKPYCWRPWLDDPGFVDGSPSRLDQLLAALNGTTEEEDYPMLRRKFEPWTIAAGAKVYQSPSTSSPVIATLAGGPGVSTHETGELVDGVWQSGDWRLLELGNRQSGWVQRSYLTPLVLGGVPKFDQLVESVLFDSDINVATGGVTPPAGIVPDSGAEKRIGNAAMHLTSATDAVAAAAKAVDVAGKELAASQTALKG